MRSIFNRPTRMLVVIGLVAAISLAGAFLFAGAKSPVSAADGCCMMQHSETEGNSGCPMSKKSGDADCTMHGGKDCCTTLDGKVTAVGRDGTVTVRVKPAAGSSDAVKKAFAGLKAGDNVSLMMMPGMHGKTAATEVIQKTAYVCPMHPEVTSDKSGQCPKCGMNLELVKPQRK